MVLLKDLKEQPCVNVLAVILIDTLVFRYVAGHMESSLDHNLPYYCSFCVCSNETNGIITKCSGLGLFRPPRNIDNETVVLNISDNLIKSIKYSSFAGLHNLETLDVSGNTISDIEVGAFRDLSNLEYLYLNGQINTRKIIVLQNIFKNGVFDGLNNLKVLHVQNLIHTSDVSYSVIPVNALKVLVALEELRIDGVNNANFNKSLNELKNLSTVVMSGFDGTCLINQLDRHSFVGLENVKNLTICKCRIKKLGKGIFWWTSKLQYLDLSWNTELEINQFGTILEELKYTELRILKINAIHNPDRAGTELLRPDIKYLRDINLLEIQMDDNGIEFVDYGVFDMFPKSLKKLYLRRNKLVFGYYLYEAVFNNPNLEVLDAGDQAVATRSDRVFTNKFQKIHGLYKRSKRSYITKFDAYSRKYHESIQPFSEVKDIKNDDVVQHVRKPRSDSLPILNLKILIYSATLSDLIPLNFSATVNNITFMDFSRNFMPMTEPLAFDGLYYLKHLNLSHNYMENIHTLTFYGLSSVEIMDLENNLLGYIFKSDKNGKLFSSLVSLRVINLSRNRISTLDKNIFKHTSKVEEIDLSDNYIEALGFDLSSLLQLKYLDLSYNRLHSIAASARSHFSSLSLVEIDLSSNHLLCTCDNIPFLKWLFNSDINFVKTESYFCTYEGTSINMFNDSNFDLVSKMEEDCKSYHEIIIGSSTVGSFVIAILVSYTVYYNRWKIRYLFYMARIKLDNANVDKETDKAYTYDCFISYGDGDRNFVTVDMIQSLEVEGGKRLNIRDRDFELGEVIAVNISKAIRTSKKTFLLLSRHFLRNKWCNFEMNMARMEEVHMKRAVLVIIFIEEIPTKVLPIEIMDLLRVCPNMDLPKEQGLRSAFWQKCLDYINTE